jgi:hypothetical protein
MPAYDPERLRTLLVQVDDAAATTQEKGKALEDITEYLFALIPGVRATARDALNEFHSEEIDIGFWNDERSDGLRQFPAQFLVECKNWQSPVGSLGVCWFLVKLERRSLKFGVLVALKGISGGASPDLKAAHEIAAYFLTKGIQLIVLTRNEIGRLKSTEELVNLLKEKLVQLVTVRRLHAD